MAGGRNPAAPSPAMNMLFVLGLAVFLYTSEVLGAQAAGFIDFVGAHDRGIVALALISIVGGAVGMSLVCLNGPYRGAVAAMSGAVAGLGIFLATYLYLSWRTSFYSAEILLPFLLGGAPGFCLLRYLMKKRSGGES